MVAIPTPSPLWHLTDPANGNPLNGGRMYFYAAGTTTPKDTWADADKVATNPNPVILDANGDAPIFLDGAYKVIAKTSADVLIYEMDGVNRSASQAGLVSFVPTLTLPVDNVQDALEYLDTGKVNRAGDTITGPLVITANVSSAPTPLAGTRLQVVGADTVVARVEIDAFAAAPTLTGRRANGTNAAKTAVALGDIICSLAGSGHNGTAYLAGDSAKIEMKAAEAWGASAAGSKIEISTTLNGTTAPALAMTIDHDNTVTVAGDIITAKASPSVVMAKTASGQNSRLLGRLGLLSRWALDLGDNTAEAGANAGSALAFSRFTDAGALIDTPISMARNSDALALLKGQISFPATPVLTADRYTLDAFDQTPFVPTLSAGGAVFSYATQIAEIQRIGDYAHVRIRIVLNTTGNTLASSAVSIPNLPFSNAGATVAFEVEWENSTTAYIKMRGSIQAGANAIFLTAMTSASTTTGTSALATGLLNATTGTVLDMQFKYKVS